MVSVIRNSGGSMGFHIIYDDGVDEVKFIEELRKDDFIYPDSDFSAKKRTKEN